MFQQRLLYHNADYFGAIWQTPSRTELCSTHSSQNFVEHQGGTTFCDAMAASNASSLCGFAAAFSACKSDQQGLSTREPCRCKQGSLQPGEFTWKQYCIELCARKCSRGVVSDSLASRPPARTEETPAPVHLVTRSVERAPFYSAPEKVKLSLSFKSISERICQLCVDVSVDFCLDARRETFAVCPGASAAIGAVRAS